MRAPEDATRKQAGMRDGDRAQLIEERRALLEQLRGYELVMNGLRMRARQLEKELEVTANRQ